MRFQASVVHTEIRQPIQPPRHNDSDIPGLGDAVRREDLHAHIWDCIGCQVAEEPLKLDRKYEIKLARQPQL